MMDDEEQKDKLHQTTEFDRLTLASLLLFVSHFKKSASMLPIQTKSTRAPGNPSVEQQKQTTKDIQIQDGPYHRGSPAVIGWELKHGEGSLGMDWWDMTYIYKQCVRTSDYAL